MKIIPILFTIFAIPLLAFGQEPDVNAQPKLLWKKVEKKIEPEPTVLVTPLRINPVPGQLNQGVVTTPSGKPQSVSLIPHQAPVPKNPAFVKDVEYIFHNDTVNPFYVSSLDGRKIPKYTSSWHIINRPTINEEFADIDYYHTNFAPPEKHFFNFTSEKDKHVLVPTDTATGRPAFSVPRFYMDGLKSQLGAGVVTMPDGNPVPSSLFRLEFNGPDMLAFFAGHRMSLSRLVQFPDLVVKQKPSIVPGLDPNLVQPDAPIVGTPSGPVPSSDGLGSGIGSPPSSPTNIVQDPISGIGAFSTWWQSNPFTSKGSAIVNIQVPFNFGGHVGTMPPPGITIDGKAFNFYFTNNGIPYALSITDANGDRVYEANIWKLRFDLDAKATRYDFAFPSYEEFAKYASSHKLVLPKGK